MALSLYSTQLTGPLVILPTFTWQWDLSNTWLAQFDSLVGSMLVWHAEEMALPCGKHGSSRAASSNNSSSSSSHSSGSLCNGSLEGSSSGAGAGRP
jgi:hypothetical protein